MNEIVAKQYTEYAYPNPIEDLEIAISKDGYYDLTSICLFKPLLWPEKVPDSLKILIAGCGTNQAAYYAYTNPNCTIVGIDLSETSLSHQQYLKEKHKLSNLILKKLDIIDAKNLETKFDLIVSTGVLHHMKSPEMGLKALKDVLTKDGLMSLMLYGKYLRSGVYMLQKVFKELGCMNQTKSDIEFVKMTINKLDPSHCAMKYIKSAGDIYYDAGLVDTFLHSQDHAYSVDEVYKFVESQNLTFIDWLDRAYYSERALLIPNDPLRLSIEKLPKPRRASVIELLTQSHGTHRFFCGNENYNQKAISFDTADCFAWYPSIRLPIQVLEFGKTEEKKSAKLLRDIHKFEIDFKFCKLFEIIDGKKTINEIVKIGQDDHELRTEEVIGFLKEMNELGHLLFSRYPFTPTTGLRN